MEGILSEGVLSEGVLSGGVFVRGGFVRRGFCPRGFCPEGVLSAPLRLTYGNCFNHKSNIIIIFPSYIFSLCMCLGSNVRKIVVVVWNCCHSVSDTDTDSDLVG